MKYLDTVEVTGVSQSGKINWNKLVVKPFIYGVMFGIGCWAGSIFIRSPLMTDLLA